jgi:hypothetical protein
MMRILFYHISIFLKSEFLWWKTEACKPRTDTKSSPSTWKITTRAAIFMVALSHSYCAVIQIPICMPTIQVINVFRHCICQPPTNFHYDSTNCYFRLVFLHSAFQLPTRNAHHIEQIERRTFAMWEVQLRGRRWRTSFSFQLSLTPKTEQFLG